MTFVIGVRHTNGSKNTLVVKDVDSQKQAVQLVKDAFTPRPKTILTLVHSK
ncbi:hypothetical protein [Methylobacillus sp.]|uniref:hypothetical protein n=1 Tax=Methylobacillus sp. TaxID=56818 RepID=UPI002579AD2E|nr:hypothetical protein [Methylobacillus sp.]